jgi:hypothetical protein
MEITSHSLYVRCETERKKKRVQIKILPSFFSSLHVSFAPFLSNFNSDEKDDPLCYGEGRVEEEKSQLFFCAISNCIEQEKKVEWEDKEQKCEWNGMKDDTTTATIRDLFLSHFFLSPLSRFV